MSISLCCFRITGDKTAAFINCGRTPTTVAIFTSHIPACYNINTQA